MFRVPPLTRLGPGGVRRWLGLAALVAVLSAPAAAVPVRPVLDLPPPPPAGRTEDQVWREALARSAALEPRVQRDLAEVKPAPVPREVSEPAPAAPPVAAAPAAPKADAPAPRPAPAVAARPRVPSLRAVQKYTARNGLPSNRVTAVFVDEEDAWVGTADAGVARLNFREGNWIVTKPEDGLTAARVSDIVKYKGLVYVGTQDGISVWDGASWRTQAQVGAVQLFNTAFRVRDDLLWVAARTMRGGLLTFDGERWADRSAMKQGIVLNNVSDFAFSGKTLWIGTTNRGVYRFDGENWTTFTVADGIASNFVYTLAVRDGTCYLGGCCGVSAYEGGQWRVYDLAEGLPHSTVNTIAVDGDLVWFGSKKGLALFDGFSFTNFGVDSGLVDERITAIFVHGDDLWVGTAEGLTRFSKTF
ncbi:MAG: ligand-binding sensor domain-containing protein [Deferrisomatales bacterium]